MLAWNRAVPDMLGALVLFFNSLVGIWHETRNFCFVLWRVCASNSAFNSVGLSEELPP